MKNDYFRTMKNLIIGFLFVSILACFGIYAFVSKENQPNPDAPTRWINPEFSKAKSSEIIVSLIDSNVTCVKNSNNILPLNDLNVKSAFISLGGNSQSFVQRIQEFSDGKFVQIFQTSQLNIMDSIQADRIVVSLHPSSPDSLNIENWVLDGLLKIPKGKERILVVFGNLPRSAARWVSNFDAIVFAPENHPIMQDIVAQKIMGSYGINGLLKRSIHEFKTGQGIAISSNGRLKFNSPEQLGMKFQEFERIDQIGRAHV